MIIIFTLLQILCYQLCAVPGIYRIIKRRSSEDLSIWREILILSGASFQLMVFLLANAPPILYASPVTSIISVSIMLAVILGHRVRPNL